MKCIKLTMDFKECVRRTSDETAEQLVDRGQAEYTSKSVWKRNGRHYLKGGDLSGNN